MPPPLLRILRSPATTFIAGAVFLTSVAFLPIGARSPSIAGQLLSLLTLRARGTYCVFPYHQQWYKPVPNGFAPVPDAKLTPAVYNDPNSVIVSVDTHPSGSRGVWALTSHTSTIRITVSGTGLLPGDAAKIRTLYVNQLVAEGDPMITREMPGILTTDVNRTTVLWSGWIHNGVSLVSFAALIPSLPNLPRRMRERNRASRGLCPRCAYDLHATPAAAPCPECGTPTR